MNRMIEGRLPGTVAELFGIPMASVTPDQVKKLRSAFVHLVYGPEGLSQVKDEVHDMCGVSLTDDQTTELVLDSTSLANWFLAGGASDTVMREGLAETLYRKILGRPWPRGMNDTERKQFFADFHKKALEMGYASVE